MDLFTKANVSLAFNMMIILLIATKPFFSNLIKIDFMNFMNMNLMNFNFRSIQDFELMRYSST